MARTRRGLKSGCKATTLNGTASSGATSVVCTDLSTWSGVTTNGPAAAVINRGLSDEEIVTFTGISTNTLTGVSALSQTHATGTIEHCSTYTDFNEANELVTAMANNSCRAYKDSDTTITTGVLTAMPLNQERFDTGGLHSTSVNNSRITIVTAGKYLITASIEWAADPTGYRQLGVLLNGTDQIANTLVTAVASPTVTQQTVSTIWSLAAADYVQMVVAHTKGADLAVSAVAKFSPEFSVALIGL